MAAGIRAKLTVEAWSLWMLVSAHWALLPALAHAPVQFWTWKPALGTAVQALLPPALTVPGVQLTLPLPPATLAVIA